MKIYFIIFLHRVIRPNAITKPEDPLDNFNSTINERWDTIPMDVKDLTKAAFLKTLECMGYKNVVLVKNIQLL